MSNQFCLDHLNVFTLEGPDACAYAQSQFTVDVDKLSAGLWQPLAWCTPKGRVISFMMGRASEPGIDLVLPASQTEDVRKRLERFTIGRRVTISTAGPVAGAFAPDDSTPSLAVDPARGMLAHTQASSDPEARQRWQRLDLSSALPWLTPASSEQHLPQWLGLEALGALVYDKGCYPGQEVIARVHYRGSVKYGLTGIEIGVSNNFEVQAPISDEHGAIVGHWLYGIAMEGSTIGLAVISTRIDNGSTVIIRDGERGHEARVTPPKALC